MLYGFEEPSDLAKRHPACRAIRRSARIGPPAMTPVPAGAARRIDLAGTVAVQRRHDAGCGLPAAARESAHAWRIQSPCGWLPALRGPCRGRSPRGPSGRRQRQGQRTPMRRPPFTDLRDAVDVDQAVHELVVALFAIAIHPFTGLSGHGVSHSARTSRRHAFRLIPGIGVLT